MIIFFAGLPGTGKTTLARALSTSLAIPYYEIDEIKKEIYPTDPEYDHKLEHGIPFSDAVRTKVFDRVIDHIKTVDDLIVDETFHKKSLREKVFTTAKDSLVIWLTADEDVIRERLSRKRENHILSNALAMYESLKKEFDPLTNADIVFDNSGNNLDEAIKILVAKIDINNH